MFNLPGIGPKPTTNQEVIMSDDQENQPQTASDDEVKSIETVLNECMVRISDVCEEQFGELKPIIIAVNLTGAPKQNSQYTTATNCEPPSDLLIISDLMASGEAREAKNNFSRIVVPGGANDGEK